jgi:hypothetical protein
LQSLIHVAEKSFPKAQKFSEEVLGEFQKWDAGDI